MAKRANGAGSVKRLPSGTWRGQLMDGFQDNGKRRIVSFTAPNKAELLDKIREYKNKRISELCFYRPNIFKTACGNNPAGSFILYICNSRSKGICGNRS